MEKRAGPKKRIWLRVVGFLLGLAALLCVVQRVFVISDFRIYQTYSGFYEEKDRPLDAVYIGASNVYTNWQAPLAWERFGITVYPLSIPALPLQSVKYILEEARKTQPDALYIINMNDAEAKVTTTRIHYIADFFPWSLDKLRLISALCDMGGFEGADRLEFYFPFVRYHSAWYELEQEALLRSPAHEKGGVHYPNFLRKITNISGSYFATEETQPLAEDVEAWIEDLLQYCRENQLNVLFTLTPQATADESEAMRLNRAAALAEEAGFPVVNLLGGAETLGLDLAGDFYNAPHPNIHGSSKFVDYFGAYLVEHYGFADKRGDPAYSDWDEAAARYHELADNYLLDLELESAPRDGSMTKPLMIRADRSGSGVEVQWAASAGAEGYALYRQTIDETEGPADWERVAEVTDQTRYCDESADGETFRYTVVPFAVRDGAQVYGPFDSAGILAEEGQTGGG